MVAAIHGTINAMPSGVVIVIAKKTLSGAATTPTVLVL
jgi:hypothetical protein